MNLNLTDQEKTQLRSLWGDAVQSVPKQPAASTAQAFALGINFRLHLGHALKAAWETSKAVAKGIGAAHAPFAVWTWLEVGAEAASAAQSVIESIVQRVLPLDYVTAVILSNHTTGVTPEDLELEVETFLKDPAAKDFAWYLGMRGEKVRQAKEIVDSNHAWFEKSRERLKDLGFLDTTIGGKLMFTQIDFEVGWKSMS
jgi:hypothetical protein